MAPTWRCPASCLRGVVLRQGSRAASPPIAVLTRSASGWPEAAAPAPAAWDSSAHPGARPQHGLGLGGFPRDGRLRILGFGAPPARTGAWAGPRPAAQGFLSPTCKAASTTTTKAPLPNDPGVLKLLLAAKDGELAAKDGELRTMDKYVKSVEHVQAVMRAQIMSLENRLGCRWVLEDLEKKMSALRQRQPKASRAAVWRDVFASDPAFYKKMLRAADLDDEAVALTGKKLANKVAEKVVQMYGDLSDDIHNPKLGGSVPIVVQFMEPCQAAMMILCCQALRVTFSVYDSGGARVAWPPPEVARLLGEDWEGQFME